MTVTLNKQPVKAVAKAVKKAATPPPAVEADFKSMNVQLIALKNLKSYGRNAKKHTPAQIDEIVALIKEFKFRDPISVNSDNEIIEGHGRVAALTKMGATHVPAFVITDMTALQERAYRIAHNQSTLSTGFDVGQLTLELRDLNTSGFDLAFTGFSAGDLEAFELQMDIAAPTAAPEAVAPSDPDPEPVGGEPLNPITTYQYVLIFDDQVQQKRWNGFIKHLKSEVEGETISERLDSWLQQSGF